MPTGLHVSATTSDSITWTWNVVVGATAYGVQTSRNEIFGDEDDVTTLSLMPTHTVSNLEPETSVSLRVAAGGGTSLDNPVLSDWTTHVTGMSAPPPPPSPGITVSPSDASVEVGHTIRFTATVVDASGEPVRNPEITWTTSDASQAWVRSDGLVTGAGRGQPSVIAQSGDLEGSAGLTVTASPITNLLLGVHRQYQMIGLAGAIVTSDGLVEVGAVGTRAYESEVPVTIHDKWHLGSITKSMTATLAAVLVERGVLEWTTTLEGAFPDFTGIRPELRPVTIEPILAHRGGFTNDLNQFSTWEQSRTSTDPLRVQRRAIAKEVLGTAPEFSPLNTFHYSNTGYIIAGAMLEAVADEEWETLMRAELFAPLGMADTGFGAPGVAGAMDQPRGHDREGTARTALEPDHPWADNPPALGPAGTVHATMQDLARYVALHLAGEQERRDLLLPAETIRRLHTPAPGFDYASGWGVTQGEWAGGRVLAHSGSNTLWTAVIWMAPEKDFAVLVATNQWHIDEAVHLAGWRLIQHQLGITTTDYKLAVGSRTSSPR